MQPRLTQPVVVFFAGSVVGMAVVGFFYLIQQVSNSPQQLGQPPVDPVEFVHGDLQPDSKVRTRETGYIESLFERAAAARSFDSEWRRAWELEQLFSDMTKENAPSILAAILDNPDKRATSGLLLHFFGRWGEIDPASALNEVKVLQGKPLRIMTENIFNHWARVDLGAAWIGVQDYLEDPKLWSAGEGVIEQIVLRNRSGVIEYLNTLGRSRINQMVRERLVKVSFDSGQPEKLLEDLREIESSETRRSLLREVFRKWGEDDSDGALNALERIDNASEAQWAMREFLNGWSKAEPSAAFEYAYENQTDPAVRKTFRTLLSDKMKHDSLEEKEAIFEKFAAAGLLEKYGSIVVNAVRKSSPEAAIALVDRVPDTGQNWRMVLSVVSTLSDTDFGAALAYYDQVESDEVKGKLLTILAHGTRGRMEGGDQLRSLLETEPSSEKRSVVIEAVLEAVVANADFGPKPSDDFLEVLKEAADANPNLSRKGRAFIDQVYGE